MKKILSILPFAVVLLFAVSATAGTQFIVVPGGPKTINVMKWRGDWAAGNKYHEGQTVHFDGSSFVCIHPHNSSNSNTPPNILSNIAARVNFPCCTMSGKISGKSKELIPMPRAIIKVTRGHLTDRRNFQCLGKSIVTKSMPPAKVATLCNQTNVFPTCTIE